MVLTPRMFLIVCPLLFLAGFVDAIGGGGGLISLPAYLLAGLPAHTAIATNKLSSACGTSLSTARFLKNGLVNIKIALPSAAAALIGSAAGAKLSLGADERVLKLLLLAVLPVAAFFVLNPRFFKDRGGLKASADKKTLSVCILSALLIGCYDGFYGPSTGTFLIIAFTAFAQMSAGSANAQAKVINLTSNVTSLTVFLLNGQILFPLGLAGAACNMAGNYLGSGLAVAKGAKITRPVIIAVLILLLLKIIFDF